MFTHLGLRAGVLAKGSDSHCSCRGTRIHWRASLVESGDEEKTQEEPSVPQSWNTVPVFPELDLPTSTPQPTLQSQQLAWHIQVTVPRPALTAVLSPQPPSTAHLSTPCVPVAKVLPMPPL